MAEFKSGFVSLIGRPSAGKSTLINYICGYKVSIVSAHPQTTRFLVRGIYTNEAAQIVFIDTPGVHDFNSNLNRGLSNLAVRNIDEADLVLYVVDLTRKFGAEEQTIIDSLAAAKQNVIVVFNKSDVAENDTGIMREVLSRLNVGEHSAPYIIVSSKHGKNMKDLVKLITDHLPEGPMYYPDDYVTDQTIPFRISEVVREKIFRNTGEEVPHSTYVEVEKLNVTDDKIVAHATVFTETESQKGILVGKGGSKIKKIGMQSREELAEIFERSVNLFLNVKVNPNWRKNDALLKKMFDIM
ncbi:MAG: GTPase Era [Spirochaetales bacterium]|nr:GTPase Era [Spirochaetales bacterium]